MKATMRVSAELAVTVGFSMEVDTLWSLEETEKRARAAASNIAHAAIGHRGDSVTATVSNIKSLTRTL